MMVVTGGQGYSSVSYSEKHLVSYDQEELDTEHG